MMHKLKWLLPLLLCCGVAGAQVKISGLPAGAALAGAELIPMVQSSATVTTTPNAISSFVGASNLTVPGNWTFTGIADFAEINVISTMAGAAVVSKGEAGSWGGYELQDGQSGTAIWQILSGYCQSAAPGVFGIYSDTLNSTPLCMGADGGIYLQGATGGDKGLGTINAQGLYVNGTAVGGSTSGANPSASLGLTAVNGSATTYMRSDGAPALSQSIAPTWTGDHIWTPSSGVAIWVDGATANSDGILVSGSPTTGQSYGIGIAAGTNASDSPLSINNQAGTQGLFKVFGDGGTTSGSPTGGDEGLGSINAQQLYVNGAAVATAATGCSSGSFTATMVGYTTSQTGTVDYWICGITVTLYFPSAIGNSGTSNATYMGFTGLPSPIQPTNNEVAICSALSSATGAQLATGIGSVGPGQGTGAFNFEIPIISGSQIIYSGTAYASSGTGVKFIFGAGNCTYPLH